MSSCRIYLLIALFVGTFISSCETDEPAPSPPAEQTYECDLSAVSDKGSRSMGLDLLNITETNSFEENLAYADELGMEFIALHTTWAGLEPTPQGYTDPFDAILLIGQAAEDNGMRLSLTIRPIDITGKTVPSDLEGSRFNEPEMATRFNALIDYVFTRVDPASLHNLMIGNEIDGYDTSGEDPAFWSDYGSFLFDCKEYIHSIAPDLEVGFTGTHSGMLESPEIFGALATAVDILGVTYYPLNGDFTVQDPAIVHEDMDGLVQAFPGVDIHLQEVGYQSGEVCNSSEAEQAEFFCQFFAAWDQHTDRIHSANVVRLNDLSEADALASAGPYGISAPTFVDYLRTLGIRTFDGDGDRKQAFVVISENMAARGWE